MGDAGHQVLGDVWLEEFRTTYPDYRSSKKNLFRKYKWWRSRKQEGRREGGAGREQRQVSGQLYQEVRALLESSQVILPPFVSSKVRLLLLFLISTPTLTPTSIPTSTPGDPASPAVGRRRPGGEEGGARDPEHDHPAWGSSAGGQACSAIHFLLPKACHGPGTLLAPP